MKPIDAKNNTYINMDKEINDKYPKFKVGDHVRMSKYKNINDADKQFPDTSDLAKKADLNAKISEIEKKYLV